MLKLFGRSEKKKKKTSQNWKPEEIVLYQLVEPPNDKNRAASAFFSQNENYNESQNSLYYQQALAEVHSCHNTSEGGLTYIYKDKDILLGSTESSDGEEQCRRKNSSRKVSVLVPLTETSPHPGQRRASRILEKPDGINRTSLWEAEEQPRRRNPPRKASFIVPFAETGPDTGQRRVSRILDKPDGINRTSLWEAEEQPRRRNPPRKASLIVPFTETGPDTGQRRVSRVLDKPVGVNRVSLLEAEEQTGPDPSRIRVSRRLHPTERLSSEFQTRKLTWVLEDPEPTRLSPPNNSDFKSSRPLATQPVGSDEQVRLSTVEPSGMNADVYPERLYLVKQLDERERFPLNSAREPAVYAVRRSINKPPKRKSFSLKRLFMNKRDTEEQGDRGITESQEEQSVYVVPTTPTRGRTRSVLQQSVKTLTSQKEEAPVTWKNIRYSTDTDVFSAGVRRRNEKPVSPGYVNMERGQGMLVSDFLNPITSIFVSDLKDPVPKDPMTKPRECNNWVRPRQNSLRQIVTPIQPKRPTQVKVASKPPHVTYKISKQKMKYSQYDSEDDDSSYTCSDESIKSYRPRSKYSPYNKPTHHRLYAAKLPSITFHDMTREMEENKESAVSTPASHIATQCSLDSDVEEEQGITFPHNLKRLSKVEKKSIVDTLNFLCHPPGNDPEDTTLAAGSGTKKRCQTTIKNNESTEN